VKTSTRNSPEDKTLEQEKSQEEEELIDVPTTNEERVRNSDKFYRMHKTSLVHQGIVKGSEDSRQIPGLSRSGWGTF